MHPESDRCSVPRLLSRTWSEFFYPYFPRIRCIYAVTEACFSFGCKTRPPRPRNNPQIFVRHVRTRPNDRPWSLFRSFRYTSTRYLPHQHCAPCTIALEIQRINLWLASGRVFAFPTSWASWIIITRRVGCEMRSITKEPPVCQIALEARADSHSKTRK